MPLQISYNQHIRPILSDRCFICHGPDANKREAGLRLDTPEGAFAALRDQPNAHAIVANAPEKSALFLRITTKDSTLLMPPANSNLALTAHEIALLKKWIEQGAEYENHWSFVPPAAPILPEGQDIEAWAHNDIDRFIYQKAREKGLKPNAQADKERLLKRLCLDLTGLPPSIEQQNNFLNDNAENAYERMVDTLLASQHFGEKMAVFWLDIARYADSHGYQDDGYRSMWPWRDWVIHAFNQNYSYKQFVTWQLAGDLIPEKSRESLLATGFNRNHKITQEGGVIDEEYRIEYVSDRTNTFGKAFLGLTIECAKCHDHKYDPIAQKDYYALSAFFNQVDEKGFVGDINLASVADPPKMIISRAEADSLLHFVRLRDSMPVEVMVMGDVKEKRPTHLLARGLYDHKADIVQPSTPKSVLPFDSAAYTSDRSGLAAWLFSEKNPITARVAVNLFWQELFGQGLVRTSGDFGLQGDAPSHPALLDYLALDFVRSGWDIKALLKKIVRSATYRQSATRSEKQLSIDPENTYLSSFPRKKIKAEFVRDVVLSTSGLLVKEIGGLSVKPYQPKGVWEASSSGRGQLARYTQDEGANLYRRGLYTIIKRTAPPPNMLIFDASNRDQCEVQRLDTKTPLQALALLNDPMVLEAAQQFAEQITIVENKEKEALTRIFQQILCRKPSKTELRSILDFYATKQMRLQKAFGERIKNTESEQKKAASKQQISYKNPAEEGRQQALVQVALLLYNLEEAMVRG